MNFEQQYRLLMTRRQLLGRSAAGIGTAALASLLNPSLSRAVQPGVMASASGGLPGLPNFAPKAKRVIYMFMSGGPSHIDLFDYKPSLQKLNGTELPDSVLHGRCMHRCATSGQKSFPCAAPIFKFSPQGKSGTYLSEVLPHLGKVVDDICIVKAVNTEAINHDPAITFINTGSQQPGRPSIGSWLSYGLGMENQENLLGVYRDDLAGQWK